MDKITQFIMHYEKSTQATYRSYLKTYFDTIKVKNPDKYIEKSTEEIEKDIFDFVQKQRGKPPKTIITNLATIKSFLIEYKIYLEPRTWKRINKRIKGRRAITPDTVPDNHALKQILQHAPLKHKALFLTLATSGMRIGECLQLTTKDIDLEYKPPKIEIPASITKTGNPRITFITTETKEILAQWINKERAKYIKTSLKRGFRGYKKLANNNRIFPFSTETARNMWITVITKAELNQQVKITNRFRYKTHIHCLRKYFTYKMKTAIPEDIVETLTGHISELKQVYDTFPIETLAEHYLKAEEKITILQTTPDTTEIEEQQKYLQKQIDELKQENIILRTEQYIAQVHFNPLTIKDVLTGQNVTDDDYTPPIELHKALTLVNRARKSPTGLTPYQTNKLIKWINKLKTMKHDKDLLTMSQKESQRLKKRDKILDRFIKGMTQKEIDKLYKILDEITKDMTQKEIDKLLFNMTEKEINKIRHNVKKR